MKFLILFLVLIKFVFANEQKNTGIVLVENAQENFVKTDEKIEVSKEVFVATNEWQEVKPGQSIPPGLHVRLNIQTGVKEAKLLSEEPDKPVKEPLSKEFEDALKKINNDPNILENLPDKTPDEVEKEQKVKNKFKSYEQIKQEMSELNLNVQTDFEIMNSLIAKLNQTELEINKLEKLNLLKDLEYYVHQYDNGMLLCDMGGFDLLLKELNKTTTTINDDSEENQIKNEALLVLGSALQSNPKVKVFAIKTELLQMLLNRLSSSVNSESNSKEFQSKLVFTLSALLRNFPFAQSQFIRFGGVQTLSNLISLNSSSIDKIKIKILTLADDLIKEKIDISQTKQDTNDTNLMLKIEQYKDINLVEEFIEKNWCDHFEPLLKNAQNHDSREKILISMWTLRNECWRKLAENKSVFDLLDNLHFEYSEQIRSDQDDNDYFRGLLDLVKNLLGHLRNNQKQEL